MRLLQNKAISMGYSVSLDGFLHTPFILQLEPRASWVGDEHSLLFTVLGKVLLGQLLTGAHFSIKHSWHRRET